MGIKTAAALRRAWSSWKGNFPAFMARLERDDVPYLSHSRVSLFERCERCYYRRYVLGEDDTTEAMHVGNLFHEAAKLLYTVPSDATPSHLLGRLNLRGLTTERRDQLRNAVTLLCENRREGGGAISVEEPFFMDLVAGSPPVIGVVDLILRQGARLLVVDHKTSTRFNDLASDQLVLYAEHSRRRFGAKLIDGFYDEYRLVTNLSRIRTPAFRRTSVSVGRTLLAPLIRRYRAAWTQIAALDVNGEPDRSPDCWACKPSWY